MGTCSIFRVTKYGKVLLYLMEEAPIEGERLHRLLGFEDLSRFDASFCNSDTDLVGNKRSLCSTRSVSAEFFLYHLHIGCLKETIPHTPQVHSVFFLMKFPWGYCP